MASLDMSLNDMIKSRKKNERGQGSARRGRGGGSFRGGRATGLGVNSRPSASAISKPIRRRKNLPWQNDLLEDSLKAAGLENGTKLYVSNLAHGVSNEDIRELYLEIGELIRYGIHYDSNGRPSGSAEVVFARKSDAIKAVKKYNNVQLDGKPMKIEIVGAKAENIHVPISARMNFNVVSGSNKRKSFMTAGTGRTTKGGGSVNVKRNFKSQRGRGGMKRGGGGGRGGGKKGVEKSVEELDKELENYHSEAMQS